MRIPFTDVHRAFPEFDSLSQDEVRRYVHYVRTTRSFQVYVAPGIGAFLAGMAWPTLLLLAVHFGWFPVPRFGSLEGDAVALLVSDAVIMSAVYFLWRDLALWWGVRSEVHRARCPKCRHSLQGLRIEEIGLGLDPTMRFVRCTECGRKHRLMDLGLSPMDLVPFEMRGVAEDFAKPRLSRSGRSLG